MSQKYNKIDHYYFADWVSKNIKKDANWGKWNYTPKGSTEQQEWPRPPSEEEMMSDILSRVEDEGFFKDMVVWLKNDAPRKLKQALREMCEPMHAGPVAYDRLCEVLYQIGFRANDVLERRMKLGPANDWVRRYFDEFPPKVGS